MKPLAGLLWLALASALAGAQAMASSHTQEARDWSYRQQLEERRKFQEQFDGEKKSYGTWPTDKPGTDAPAPSGSNRGATGDSLAVTRATLLKRAPLPADRNPLLGRWAQPESRQATNNGLAGQIESMLGGATCSTLFGRDPVEFRPDAMVVGGARATAIPVHYRAGQGPNVFALPQRGFELILFEMQGRDRAIVKAGSGCTLNRIGGAVAAAAPRRVAATAPVQTPAPAGPTGPVFDGAGFRCADGGLYHVTGCRGDGPDATCQLTELHRLDPNGFPLMTDQRRAAIAARVRSCEVGGFQFAGRKPIFVQ